MLQRIPFGFLLIATIKEAGREICKDFSGSPAAVPPAALTLPLRFTSLTHGQKNRRKNNRRDVKS